MTYTPGEPVAKKRTGLYITLIVVAVLAAAATGILLALPSHRTSAASSSPTPSWSPMTFAAAPAIPANIQQACDLNSHMRAASDGDLTNQGATIRQIQQLLAGSDPSLRLAADMMADQLTLAIRAKGASDEFAMTAGLLTDSLRLETACIEAGWRSS